MITDERAGASQVDERPEIDQDPGHAWGSRSDGCIAPAFDYMDEDLEEAMIEIGTPAAIGGPPIAPADLVGPD